MPLSWVLLNILILFFYYQTFILYNIPYVFCCVDFFLIFVLKFLCALPYVFHFFILFRLKESSQTSKHFYSLKFFSCMHACYHLVWVENALFYFSVSYSPGHPLSFISSLPSSALFVVARHSESNCGQWICSSFIAFLKDSVTYKKSSGSYWLF